MAPARGDSKPCTHVECIGRMQFRREAESELRWVCDKNPQHLASLAEPASAVSDGAGF